MAGLSAYSVRHRWSTDRRGGHSTYCGALWLTVAANQPESMAPCERCETVHANLPAMGEQVVAQLRAVQDRVAAARLSAEIKAAMSGTK